MEALRNVPLLLYLFLWYALIVTSLPSVRDAWEVLPHVFLSNSGLTVPSILVDKRAHRRAARIVLRSRASALRCTAGPRPSASERGRSASAWPSSLLALAGSAVLAYPDRAARLDGRVFPRRDAFDITGGAQLTPGIHRTSRRSRPLGFGGHRRDRAQRNSLGAQRANGRRRGHWACGTGRPCASIVLPQALRVIIPPLTSSYLSLFKNSSLAIAIGYPDLVMVSNTTMNQTGQAIEGIAIFMLVYLGLSIAISLFMNWYNSRVALKER